MTRAGSGAKFSPVRRLPGFAPKTVSSSIVRTLPSMISTLGCMENFIRSCAERTRSNSTAISRRDFRASKSVIAPRPGPVLKPGGIEDIAKSIHYARSRRFVRQEMLSQFGLAWTRLDGSALRHIDHLSFRHLDWRSCFVSRLNYV